MVRPVTRFEGDMRLVLRTVYFSAIFLVVVALVLVKANCQTSEELAWCGSSGALVPDLVIGGCSAVIQSTGKTTETLAVAFNNRGMAFRLKGEYERAITDYDQAIKLNPAFANAWNNRGIAYKHMGDVDRAIANYSEAIWLSSNYTAAFYNRGVALEQKGEYDRAIADFNFVLRADPQNAFALYQRGKAELQKGNITDGNSDLVAARAIKPDIAEEIERETH
jgi:tetratricopeptide (TPR) repeat protein